jgi:hypothetical protein
VEERDEAEEEEVQGKRRAVARPVHVLLQAPS